MRCSLSCQSEPVRFGIGAADLGVATYRATETNGKGEGSELRIAVYGRDAAMPSCCESGRFLFTETRSTLTFTRLQQVTRGLSDLLADRAGVVVPRCCGQPCRLVARCTVGEPDPKALDLPTPGRSHHRRDARQSLRAVSASSHCADCARSVNGTPSCRPDNVNRCLAGFSQCLLQRTGRPTEPRSGGAVARRPWQWTERTAAAAVRCLSTEVLLGSSNTSQSGLDQSSPDACAARPPC